MQEPPNVRPLGRLGWLMILVMGVTVENTIFDPNVLLTFSYWKSWKFWPALGGKNLAWPTDIRMVVDSIIVPSYTRSTIKLVV